eukprot:SAG31_NODE_2028_length_6632_cov_16.536660_2_plen_265_part_00
MPSQWSWTTTARTRGGRRLAAAPYRRRCAAQRPPRDGPSARQCSGSQRYSEIFWRYSEILIPSSCPQPPSARGCRLIRWLLARRCSRRCKNTAGPRPSSQRRKWTGSGSKRWLTLRAGAGSMALSQAAFPLVTIILLEAPRDGLRLSSNLPAAIVANFQQASKPRTSWTRKILSHSVASSCKQTVITISWVGRRQKLVGDSHLVHHHPPHTHRSCQLTSSVLCRRKTEKCSREELAESDPRPGASRAGLRDQRSHWQAVAKIDG